MYADVLSLGVDLVADLVLEELELENGAWLLGVEGFSVEGEGGRQFGRGLGDVHSIYIIK